VPPEVGGCAAAGVLDGVDGVVCAAPVGAGAAAWVVAGRFAQPASNAPVTSNDASVTYTPRLSSIVISLLW
jgi:hypothetical protein